MIVRKLFEVEAAQLFEPDNRQTRIERVELANLDVGLVQIVRVVRQLGQLLVAKLLRVLRRVIGDAQHAVEGAFLAAQPHTDIDEGNALSDKQIENRRSGRTFIDANESEGHPVEVLCAGRVNKLGSDRKPCPKAVVARPMHVRLRFTELRWI